ncbi:MAG: sensor histidine kinase [Chloroflexota bacterium]
MERTALTARIFVAVMAGALVALVLGLVWYALSETVLFAVHPALLALAAVSLAVLAAAVVTIILGGSIVEEGRRMVALAQRGRSTTADADPGAAFERLALTLDERNRQVSQLAARGLSAPVDEDARLVASYVVDTARTVSGDSTWLLAVLISESSELLPVGLYDADTRTEPAPLTDLHRWASVASGTGIGSSARKIEGPWGAFVAVGIDVPSRMAAVLYAPWEGRADPSNADLDLLALVGQHGATALDHALLYARVRAQASELDRLARVQADFLRGVTHDLQTPLTSIRALASELNAGAQDEDTRNDLDVIALQAERLRRMVSQLLIVSRLDAGALQPRIEVVRVRPLVERVWAALRPAGHRLELSEHGPQSLAIADTDRVELVLWAQLDNAVKYSPGGSPVEVRIETRPAEPAQIVIRVRDVGIGMDEATRSRAFDQFYRSEHARRLVPDGSGVGLYAVKGLVEAMGGNVAATSRLGEGAEIRLSLPAELVDADGQDLRTGVVRHLAS